MTPTKSKTAPPPEWRARPGVLRPLPVLHAANAYAAAVRLGLTLPAEVTDAVARASRANMLRIDIDHEVATAEAAYGEAVRAHLDDPSNHPMPDLGALAVATAGQQAATRAVSVLAASAEDAERVALDAVRAAGPDLIEQAAPMFEALLDDLAEAVAAIPVTVHDLAGAAKAGRAALAGWQSVEDALPRHDDLRLMREKLLRLSMPTGADQLVRDGLLTFKDPEAATRLLPTNHDAAAILVGVVRGRATVGPWLPTDARIAEHLTARREARAAKKGGRDTFTPRRVVA